MPESEYKVLKREISHIRFLVSEKHACLKKIMSVSEKRMEHGFLSYPRLFSGIFYD
jgi:hypothetical protein